MNRDKIVDIATKLPREAYIDLLCAGAERIRADVKWTTVWSDRHPNISKNQALAIAEAYEEGKEEEHE